MGQLRPSLLQLDLSHLSLWMNEANGFMKKASSIVTILQQPQTEKWGKSFCNFCRWEHLPWPAIYSSIITISTVVLLTLGNLLFAPEIWRNCSIKLLNVCYVTCLKREKKKKKIILKNNLANSRLVNLTLIYLKYVEIIDNSTISKEI